MANKDSKAKGDCFPQNGLGLGVQAVGLGSMSVSFSDNVMPPAKPDVKPSPINHVADCFPVRHSVSVGLSIADTAALSFSFPDWVLK